MDAGEHDPRRSRTREPSIADPVEDLVAQCLARGDDREALVGELCARHPEHAAAIRARIEALREVGLLDAATVERATREPPRSLGEFTLLRRLGGGGMGVVYLAEQTSLGRRVALKLIRPDHLFFPESRERFRREVEAVAQLQHPGIVPVHSVGEQDGLPYFAMEYVGGCTLAEALERLKNKRPAELDGRDLLAAIPADAESEPAGIPSLFRAGWEETCLRVVHAIAEALEHAHARRILHRDIKPSNVMITRGGRVMLLDFGLARAEGAASLTRTGSQLGSLPYMAPEQVLGIDKGTDRRTDLYSLGVTLYELLALHSPYESENSEVSRARILAGERAALGRLNPAVSWEAETVCLTCMERDAARRYASAAELARDLSNVLGHRPIEARRASWLLRARRWVQRHPVASVALSLVVVSLAVGQVLFARQKAADLRHAEGLRLTAMSALTLPSDPGLAQLMAIEGAERNPDRDAMNAVVAALNGCYEQRCLVGHAGNVAWGELSPDDRRVVTASEDRTAKVWDASSGECLLTLVGHEDELLCARFSPDGRRVLTAGKDRTARIWDAFSGSELHVLRGHDDEVLAAEFDPTGTFAVTASMDCTARLWGADYGCEIAVLRGHAEEIYAVCFTRDATRVLTASYDGTARIWECPGGREILCLEPESDYYKGIRHAEYSPDERFIVTASNNTIPCIWDAHSGERLRKLPGHRREVLSARFSPDGRWIATASYDGTARIWDASTGAQHAVLDARHQGEILNIDFSPDSRRVLTSSTDAMARLWDVAGGAEVARLRGHRASIRARFSHDGTRVITVSGDHTARLWDAATGARFADVQAHESQINALALSPGGQLLATASADGTARIWDAANGLCRTTLEGHEASVLLAEFSSDGRLLVTGSYDRTARIWDVTTGREIEQLPGHELWLRFAHFSPDAARVVTGYGGILRVWTVASGELIWQSPKFYADFQQAMFVEGGARVLARSDVLGLWHSDRVEGPVELLEFRHTCAAVAVHPDEHQVVAGYNDGKLRVWDLSSWTEVHEWQGHADAVSALLFSLDGRRAISVSRDGTVKVWDPASWSLVVTLPDFTALVISTACSQDARRVVTVSGGAAQVWDTPSREMIAVLRRDEADVLCAALSPAGDRVYAGFSDGRLLVWTLYDDPLSAARARRPRALTAEERVQLGLGRGE